MSGGQGSIDGHLEAGELGRIRCTCDAEGHGVGSVAVVGHGDARRGAGGVVANRINGRPATKRGSHFDGNDGIRCLGALVPDEGENQIAAGGEFRRLLELL